MELEESIFVAGYQTTLKANRNAPAVLPNAYGASKTHPSDNVWPPTLHNHETVYATEMTAYAVVVVLHED